MVMSPRAFPVGVRHDPVVRERSPESQSKPAEETLEKILTETFPKDINRSRFSGSGRGSLCGRKASRAGEGSSAFLGVPVRLGGGRGPWEGPLRGTGRRGQIELQRGRWSGASSSRGAKSVPNGSPTSGAELGAGKQRPSAPRAEPCGHRLGTEYPGLWSCRSDLGIGRVGCVGAIEISIQHLSNPSSVSELGTTGPGSQVARRLGWAQRFSNIDLGCLRRSGNLEHPSNVLSLVEHLPRVSVAHPPQNRSGWKVKEADAHVVSTRKRARIGWRARRKPATLYYVRTNCRLSCQEILPPSGPTETSTWDRAWALRTVSPFHIERFVQTR